MRRTTRYVSALAAAVFAASCAAPAPPPAPPTTLDSTIASARTINGMVKGNITAAAEAVPEAMYAFHPNPEMPEVRTMGQIFAHIAEASRGFCGTASGMTAPDGPAWDDELTKAEIQQALTDAFGFCDGVFSSMTSEQGAETLDMFGMTLSRVGVLGFHNAHINEHYGNIVTYMRINGLVPPSSQ